MLLAVLFFTGMHGCIKMMASFHVLEIVFFRSGITAVMCMIYLRVKGIPFKGRGQKDLLLRSLFGIISMTLFFITLQRMPLGAAVTLKYLSPIFAAAFAYLMLKEDVRPIQWVFFLAAFAGVLLLKGFDERIDLMSLLFGLVGAIFGGLVYMMIRKIGHAEHPMVIINYFMSFATILSGIGMIAFWRTPASTEWLFLVGMGMFGYFGQVYMTKSLQLEMTSRVAPMKYMEVIGTLILGFVWFGEGYTMMSLLGIVVIMGSMLLNLSLKNKQQETRPVISN